MRDRGRVWFVFVPELCGAGGREDISRKLWLFCGWKRPGGSVDGRSLLEVANIGGWPESTVTVKERGRRRGCDVDVNVDSTQTMERFPGRRLVGTMENGSVSLPSAM